QGQIAFYAGTSDGGAGIWVATPSDCDPDGDGFCSAKDNCPAFRNTDQRDSDGDGIGNACDNCPYVANPDQLDSNAPGRGDACAPCGTGPGAPLCGTHTVGAGQETFTIPNVPVGGSPPRPLLHVEAFSNVPGMKLEASVALDPADSPDPNAPVLHNF